MSIHLFIRTLAIAAAAVALGGCAGGPAFQAVEPAPLDRAQFYVYRPMVLAGGALVHKISIDGNSETLSLPNASWRRVLIAPGTHTVTIRDFFDRPCGGVSIDVGPGQTAYIGNVVSITNGLGVYYIGCDVTTKTQDQALSAMAGLAGAP